MFCLWISWIWKQWCEMKGDRFCWVVVFLHNWIKWSKSLTDETIYAQFAANLFKWIMQYCPSTHSSKHGKQKPHQLDFLTNFTSSSPTAEIIHHPSIEDRPRSYPTPGWKKDANWTLKESNARSTHSLHKQFIASPRYCALKQLN